MAYKTFDIEDVGTLTIYKRRDSRQMKLSVNSSGKIKLTIPTMVPYGLGINFALSKKQWLIDQIAKKFQVSNLVNGQTIGKNNILRMIVAFNQSNITSRVKAGEITVKYPSSLTADNQAVQTTARKACIRGLRLEAESFLPGQLREMAIERGFRFASVRVKQLKGRWGSCDQDRNIVLNLFLMQLPDDLINYVLLHELIHTKYLHHGKDFWQEFMFHDPKAKQQQKIIRSYQPNILLPLAR